MIPIFPELRPHLEAVFDQAGEGGVHVITRYRKTSANFRRPLTRIIQPAGLEPWPKLFQNLRSSRETKLAEQFPIHVACSWIGNTKAVAQNTIDKRPTSIFARRRKIQRRPCTTLATVTDWRTREPRVSRYLTTRGNW